MHTETKRRERESEWGWARGASVQTRSRFDFEYLCFAISRVARLRALTLCSKPTRRDLNRGNIALRIVNADKGYSGDFITATSFHAGIISLSLSVAPFFSGSRGTLPQASRLAWEFTRDSRKETNLPQD